MDEDKSREQYKKELFIKLLLMLHAGALQHLGKIENPVTKKKEVNLDLARETIDMLDLLKEKTSGNLEDFEASTLENLIAELKITYVKVESEQAKEGNSGEKSENREGNAGDEKDI